MTSWLKVSVTTPNIKECIVVHFCSGHQGLLFYTSAKSVVRKKKEEFDECLVLQNHSVGCYSLKQSLFRSHYLT